MTVKSRVVRAPSNAKYVEFSGVVTLGEASAAKLGLPVGTEVDLGVLAVHHKNPFKRWWLRRKLVKPNILN